MNNENFIKKALIAFVLIVVILVVSINLYRKAHIQVETPDNSGGMDVGTPIQLKTLPPATAEDKG